MGNSILEKERLILRYKCQSEYKTTKETMNISKFTKLLGPGGTSRKLLLTTIILIVSGCHQTVHAAVSSNTHQASKETRDGVHVLLDLVKKPERKAPEIMPCGTTRTLKNNEEIFIQSPNFQEKMNYPNSVACEWKFQFPGRRANLSCPTFKLTEFLCFDHLEINGANGGVKNTYCGSQGPKQLVLAEEVTIKFASSPYFGNLGFQCTLVEFDDEAPHAPLALSSPCACGVGFEGSRIVGGVETKVLEFPWQAGLVRTNGTKPFCGGSLINDRYILTAAHCVTGRTPYNLEIILNAHNTEAGSEDSPPYRRSVDLIIPHKKYTSRLDYDAALIRIDPPIDLKQGKVVPVCLPLKDEVNNTYAGISAIVSGWGLTEEDGSLSSVLRKANVETMTNEECSTKYASITDRMICASSHPMDNPMDACQGDSGGPLVYNSNVAKRKHTQIGIVSWGIGCARPNKPGVYTRVTEILNWIELTTTSGSYCNESTPPFIGSA